ncbi:MULTISPECIES: non-homologous end-joining DNA ligase [unclassified Streptomyces]|uniref:non-homologous end-joining DNA ligase n=1 Tax=unclassified Streptomyces TaxID=2593676 RepID=UPI001F00C664|nr:MULTISPECIES: non-homologous end-joining DNA ligase [unclassified Streptomyces]
MEPLEPLPVIRPMLATPGPLPGVGEEAEWAFETKWDGARCVVAVAGDGSLRLSTRAGDDVTARYPELAEFGRLLGGRAAVLDGEVVALADGRPDFGLLQRRLGVVNPRRAAQLAVRYPVHLVLFDVMHLDGRPLLALPYRDRRSLLSGLGLVGPHSSVPGYAVGHGQRAWDITLRAGFEGLVAKRLLSPYTPGIRSDQWRKIKHTPAQDVLIGGWTEGRGGIAGLPGAVLAGVEVPEGLRYVGSVGSGFSALERHDLARLLAVIPRDTSPFVNPVDLPAHWVEPRLVAEITMAGWTAAGRLRSPVWHRLRSDLTRDELGG